jgi:hypothetical protein
MAGPPATLPHRRSMQWALLYVSAYGVPMSDTRRAIVYTQVSTGAQAESGLGLATSTESAIPDSDPCLFSSLQTGAPSAEICMQTEREALPGDKAARSSVAAAQSQLDKNDFRLRVAQDKLTKDENG